MSGLELWSERPFRTRSGALVRPRAARQTIRIVDLEGQQAVDTLFYRADDFSERYSSQDTVRQQGAAYVTTGTALISNGGPCDADRHGRQLRAA